MMKRIKTKRDVSKTGAGKLAIEEKVKLNCDQVAWISAVFDRLLESVIPRYPSISRYRKVVKVSAILELMEILHLEFADKAAAGNALAGLSEFNILRDYPPPRRSDGSPCDGPIFESPDPRDVCASHTKIRENFRRLKKKGDKLKKKKKRESKV